MMLGANLTADGVSYAVWAPDHARCRVVIADEHGERTLPMQIDEHGVWHVTDPLSAAGSRYAFLPGDEPETPDFWSRRQPDGVHGRSEVVDPSTFQWSDAGWRGVAPDDAIIYELHVGTYTEAGTWEALIAELPELQRLGITVLEIMPVAEFPGRRNWGYDGVYHFAPASTYGTPDDMRRFVDAAHAHNLAVILDVVYNHFGPEGNYTGRYSPYYLSEKHTTNWGPALNWDGDKSAMVRQWARQNICYWIREFHLDGFRLDATHAIVDDSPKHLLREIEEGARSLAGEKTLLLYAEDGRHDISRARAQPDGDGMDGVWADDFHHELRVHLTNDKSMWLKNYAGTAVSIAETIARGFGPTTFARGSHLDVTDADAATAFVHCLQNHDQVGNLPLGERLHHVINEDRYKVASALLCFDPEVPLIFMGQEFAASTPFCFFTDMPGELGPQVTEGRRREFGGFPAFADARLRDTIPDPQAESTFARSKLILQERHAHAHIYALYRDLLALRRSHPAMRSPHLRDCTATPHSTELIGVQRVCNGREILLLANFGPEVTTPQASNWRVLLSTDDPHYGGEGRDFGATIPARTAVIIAPE